MGKLIDNLRRGSLLHTVEEADEGFIIIRRPGGQVQFDQLAREVLSASGEDYVALPTKDRGLEASYERVLVIPFQEAGAAAVSQARHPSGHATDGAVLDWLGLDE